MKIDDTKAESLSSALSKLKKLTALQLELTFNEIGTKGTKSISKALKNLCNLE